MKYLIKHLKLVAYLLALLVLFQSCVVYNKTPSSVAETSRYNDRRMKIITKDGNEFKLYWIEEKDGNVISIKNTKRIFVDKSKITSIFKYDPELIGIASLKLALEHNGAVQIRTEKHSYDFINIEEQGDLIRGISKLNGDTLSVVIPKDQIAMIKLNDQAQSTTGNILIAVGAIFVVLTTIGLIGLSNASYL